jgi:hypothetical protein
MTGSCAEIAERPARPEVRQPAADNAGRVSLREMAG